MSKTTKKRITAVSIITLVLLATLVVALEVTVGPGRNEAPVNYRNAEKSDFNAMTPAETYRPTPQVVPNPLDYAPLPDQENDLLGDYSPEQIEHYAMITGDLRTEFSPNEQVPEPASMTALLIGGGVLLRRRRKRKAAA
jgi:hypothetical protein